MKAWLHALRLICFPHLEKKLLFRAMREAELAPCLFAELSKNRLGHAHLKGPLGRFLIWARIGLDQIPRFPQEAVSPSREP